VRAGARERAWAAGAGPDLSAGLVIDIDATITIAHRHQGGPGTVKPSGISGLTGTKLGAYFD
jgi:hypothetical protein